MPSWVEQTLHVVGRPSDVDRFVRTRFRPPDKGEFDHVLDLHRLCPLKRGEPKETYTHDSAGVLERSRTKTQASVIDRNISLVRRWVAVNRQIREQLLVPREIRFDILAIPTQLIGVFPAVDLVFEDRNEPVRIILNQYVDASSFRGDPGPVQIPGIDLDHRWRISGIDLDHRWRIGRRWGETGHPL